MPAIMSIVFGGRPPGPSAADAPDTGPPDPGTAVLPETSTKQRLLPPYKLVLHNDDVNEMLYVVATILKLTPLPQERAIECTIEAHETGHSVLLVATKERVELYVEQFASCGLTATGEPDT